MQLLIVLSIAICQGKKVRYCNKKALFVSVKWGLIIGTSKTIIDFNFGMLCHSPEVGLKQACTVQSLIKFKAVIVMDVAKPKITAKLRLICWTTTHDYLQV
jgi:hypothetical protein